MSGKQNTFLGTLYDNPLVNNLNLLGANLREEPHQSPITKRKKSKPRERRRSFYKPLQPYQEPVAAESLTLRELAQIYRERNPEKWKKRMVEKEDERRISLGIIDPDPNIVAYVERQMKRLAESKLLLEKKKLLPRTVTIELKHCIEVKQNTARRRSDVTSELSLTVIKGKHLFNHIKEGAERCEKCWVKAEMFPDGVGIKKSSVQLLTIAGSIIWDHTFTFPWGSPEMTRNNYIILTVSGETRNGDTQLIGKAALASKEALIPLSGTRYRKPLSEETIILDKAVSTPNDSAFAKLKLYPKDWSGMEDIQVVEQDPNTGRRGSMFTMLLANDDETGRMPAFVNKGNKQRPPPGTTCQQKTVEYVECQTVVLEDGTISTKSVRTEVDVIEIDQKVPSTSGLEWKPLSKEEEKKIAKKHKKDHLHRHNAVRKVEPQENQEIVKDENQNFKTGIEGAKDLEQNKSKDESNNQPQISSENKKEIQNEKQEKGTVKKELKDKSQEDTKDKKQKAKLKKQDSKDKKLEAKPIEDVKEKKKKAKLEKQKSKDKKLFAKETKEKSKDEKQGAKLKKQNSNDKKLETKE